MSQDIDDFECENKPECGIYCGNTCRLHVRLPEELVERLGKTHAWLCDSCVRQYCEETISPFWHQFYFKEKKEEDVDEENV